MMNGKLIIGDNSSDPLKSSRKKMKLLATMIQAQEYNPVVFDTEENEYESLWNSFGVKRIKEENEMFKQDEMLFVGTKGKGVSLGDFRKLKDAGYDIKLFDATNPVAEGRYNPFMGTFDIFGED